MDRVKVPRDKFNGTHPVWMGDSVYFLSDRNGPVSLFRCDTRSKTVTEMVHNHGLDLKTLSGHNGTLAYEQFGTIHLVDAASDRDTMLNVSLDGDLPALVPHIQKIPLDEVQAFGISPTGVRGLFEAHGEIFPVPAEKGDVRNLTRTSNAAKREPAWSLRIAPGAAYHRAHRSHLRAEGHADQPECRLRRRRHAVAVRQAKLGPLVGTRTWGGLVGIGGYPTLLDGGTITAPRTALYSLDASSISRTSASRRTSKWRTTPSWSTKGMIRSSSRRCSTCWTS